MPAPSPTQVVAILERLREAATNGSREPTAILSAEEHTALLNLHIHDPLSAGVVLQQLREHARTLEGWTPADVRSLNFNMYREGVRNYQRQQDAIESATNVVRIGTQRQARTRRERVHAVQVDQGHGMSASQMVETDSPRLVAVGLLRMQREGRIWFDAFHKRCFTDWNGTHDGHVMPVRAVDDSFADSVTTWFHESDRRLIKLNELTVQRIIQHVGSLDVRNEPVDWLEELEWDGEERLESLFLRGFGASTTSFNRMAGRCWFLSMVARIMEPGCKVDTMPVLIGGQGRAKSSALETLGGKWYRTASSSIDSKDFLVELHGAWVFEIQELHSLIASKLGSAKIKAVLSTRIDHFRVPFGRLAMDHKRTAVLAGTTNNRDWHSDETGGRRFWPVHVGDVDLRWLRENRAQLFAEAKFFYDRRDQLPAAPISED